MKIKNINGTSNNNCKCGSWLEHWEKFSRQPKPASCRESTCMGTDLVGAHVQKDSLTDRNWYIVPLCKKHNAKSNELTIMDNTALVSANKQETCEKNNLWSTFR